MGTAVQDDRFCGQTCRDLGLVVVSVEYRLAPEHAFPAALDDCLAAWQWLQKHAMTLGVDPGWVAVGGESAGGGLAAALAQRLCDLQGNQAAAQWLFCPMLDDRTAARRALDAADHFIWNNQLNRYAWRAYLGQEPGLPQTPSYAVPARRADLANLPPCWIGTGNIELFCAEDCDYAQRLQQAGVRTHLEVVPGAPHGFEAWAAETEMAKSYVAGARSWLQQALRRTPMNGTTSVDGGSS